MSGRWLTLSILVAFAGSPAQAMTGKAVTVVRTIHPPFWGAQPDTRCDYLIAATIGGSVVTECDTLLTGSFFRPVLSFDGRRIAFYRSGAGLSVINTDGTGLRTVVPLPDWGWEGGWGPQVAWPGTDGGSWVYYHRPSNGGGFSGEFWKVNVDDPTQKSLVVDYSPGCTGDGDPNGAFVQWFNLSADARYAVVLPYDRGGNCFGYSQGIIPHTFPPQGSPLQTNPHQTEPRCSDSNQPGCGYSGDCNSAISASGTIMYHFTGGHCQLYAHHWDHGTNTIDVRYTIGTGFQGSLDQYKDCEKWLAPGSPDVGGCFINPRGSSNSDQIVTVLCNYQYGAEYTHSSCGNNLLVANWKDKEAVFITNNPDLRPITDFGPPFWFDEPGDFWLQTPAGKEGCYEDIDGNWVKVDGAVSVHRRAAPRSGSQVANAAVEVYNLRGVRVGGGIRGAATARISRGAYVVEAHDGRALISVLDKSVSGR